SSRRNVHVGAPLIGFSRLADTKPRSNCVAVVLEVVHGGNPAVDGVDTQSSVAQVPIADRHRGERSKTVSVDAVFPHGLSDVFLYAFDVLALADFEDLVIIRDNN